MNRVRKSVNYRRKPGLLMTSRRHVWPMIWGALMGAILFHLLAFIMMNWFGLSFTMHGLAKNDQQTPEELRTIVLAETEEDKQDTLTDAALNEEEPTLDPDTTPIELEDLPHEEIVIAPGEDVYVAPEAARDISDALDSAVQEIDVKKLAEGVPDLMSQDLMPVNANPVHIQATEDMKSFDADKWYDDQLKKGLGGVDDAGPESGATTLDKLLAAPSNSLGKDSKHARIGADLLFEYDSAVMRNSAKIGLLRLASLVYKNPDVKFIIEGHTDSFGSLEYNKILSLRRAAAVREWLSKNGLDMRNIYIRGCGDSKPVVSTQGDKNQQSANRRVEIHMRKQGEEMPTDALPSTHKVDMTTPIVNTMGAHAPAVKPVEQKKPAAEEIPEPIPVEEEVPEPILVS